MLKIVKEIIDDENKDIQAINEIAIKSELSNETVSKVLTTLYVHIMQKYVNKESLYIPFVGELFVDYIEDYETQDGRDSLIETKLDLSGLMKNDISRFENMEDVFFDKIQLYKIKDLIKKGNFTEGDN